MKLNKTNFKVGKPLSKTYELRYCFMSSNIIFLVFINCLIETLTELNDASMCLSTE